MPTIVENMNQQLADMMEPLMVHKLGAMRDYVAFHAQKNGSNMAEIYTLLDVADDKSLDIQVRQQKMKAAVAGKLGNDQMACSMCTLLYGFREMARVAVSAAVQKAVADGPLAGGGNLIGPLQFETKGNARAVQKEMVSLLTRSSEVGEKQAEECVRRFNENVSEFVKAQLGTGVG